MRLLLTMHKSSCWCINILTPEEDVDGWVAEWVGTTPCLRFPLEPHLMMSALNEGLPTLPSYKCNWANSECNTMSRATNVLQLCGRHTWMHPCSTPFSRSSSPLFFPLSFGCGAKDEHQRYGRGKTTTKCSFSCDFKWFSSKSWDKIFNFVGWVWYHFMKNSSSK